MGIEGLKDSIVVGMHMAEPTSMALRIQITSPCALWRFASANGLSCHAELHRLGCVFDFTSNSIM